MDSIVGEREGKGKWGGKAWKQKPGDMLPCWPLLFDKSQETQLAT